MPGGPWVPSTSFIFEGHLGVTAALLGLEYHSQDREKRDTAGKMQAEVAVMQESLDFADLRGVVGCGMVFV